MRSRRPAPFRLLAGLVAAPLLAESSAAAARAIEQRIPFYQYTQTLVAAEEMDDRKYLAFPVTVRLSETELLIAYKRGYAHAFDREAHFDLVRFNPVTQRGHRQPPLQRGPVNLQNGELVRFANGDIACYIDASQPSRDPGSDEGTRLGLVEFRSTDGGVTFSDRGPVGRIDGVEYGYAFEALTEGNTTWMLVMTFANLPGGKSVVPSRPKAGAVAVIRTDDYGRNWRLVRNLTEAFAAPLNESSFMRFEDGFLFVCRPYSDAQPVIVTDADFNVRRRTDWVQQYAFVAKGLGRPRVFARDGGFYVLGRNTARPGALPVSRPFTTAPGDGAPRSILSLFRFDPQTLEIEKHVLLDNVEQQRVASAYYATPYWQARKGVMYFNLITYKQLVGRMPDIIRLEYEWDEVK